MRAIHFLLVKPLNNSRFLLLGIAAGLIALQLNITWKSGKTDFWGISVLFWVAVCSLVWKKRHSLNLETGWFSSFLGTLLIAAVLLKSTCFNYSFPYVSPLIAAVGLGLLASGFKGLKQYWQELLILFFLGVPQLILLGVIDISAFTAKFAAFALWYLGFEVSRQGVNVTLATVGVAVYPGCSGLENILYLLRLAVLFLVMLPTDSSQKIIVPLVAIFLGFVVNGFRVALMAVMVESSNHQAFEYWHKGDGSLIFSLISVLFFGLFCLLMLRGYSSENDDSVEI